MHSIHRPLLALLAIFLLPPPSAFAHPGHDEALPLPTWRMRDGRTLSASLLKTDATRAWFVDVSGKTSVIPIANLDATGQLAARRTHSRLRIINDAPAAEVIELVDVAAPPAATPPTAALPFHKFERVKTRFDDQFLYIESDGLPDHPMMKGIRAWQQHVPLPQPYAGENAWRLPLHPVAAKTPTPIKDHFLRGAIALAVNGVPIFNPQNNRGEIAQEIGELDEWGGHCGRADDYHYHATPFHLQTAVGKGLPIAYALDGYPIYGLTEPDGSPLAKLDECSGHTTAIGYHYHGSNKYPYVFAAFHGQVTERGGQVDPQPRGNPIRGALQPLRGATITDFKETAKDRHELTYEINGRKGYVRYALNPSGSYTFDFEDPQGQKQQQTFDRRSAQGGARPEPDRPVRPQDQTIPRVQAITPNPTAVAVGPVLNNDNPKEKKETAFILRSSEVAPGGAIPREFTGDGAGSTLPLEWSNAPAGTVSYALVMDHLDPEGNAKWYWLVYNIPADVKALPKNAKTIGTAGTNSVNNRLGYAPPHSKGPGVKNYTLTLYALSAAPVLKLPPEQVDRAKLLAAIKDRTLASAELKVTYDRTSVIGANGGNNNPDAPRDQNAKPNLDAPPGADAPPPPPSPRDPNAIIHLIPRNAEETMNISAEQQSRVQTLEKETETRLAKILTPEQLQTLKASRPPRRPNDGPPQ